MRRSKTKHASGVQHLIMVYMMIVSTHTTTMKQRDYKSLNNQQKWLIHNLNAQNHNF